jgi:hypothetical protein
MVGLAIPHSPLARLVSKHTPSVRASPIWGTKKSPIWGMCSGPPQYYNLNNREAGCPLPLPLSSKERPGSSVACAPAVLGPLERAVLNFACTGSPEVVVPASQLCYLVCKRSGGSV